jgi:hypothetical protein
MTYLQVEMRRAFANRKGILLLDLTAQVRFCDLPPVKYFARWALADRRDLVRVSSKSMLRLVCTEWLRRFPHTITSNVAVSVLRRLAAAAETEDAPLLEEIAQDIFMGIFSSKFSAAARRALGDPRLALYFRCFGVDPKKVNCDSLCAAASQLALKDDPRVAEIAEKIAAWDRKWGSAKIDSHTLGPHTELGSVPRCVVKYPQVTRIRDWSGGSYTTPDPNELKRVEKYLSWDVKPRPPRATNGQIIEWVQILTGHNFLFLMEHGDSPNNLVENSWRGVLDLVRHPAFSQNNFKVILQKSKNAAYAWRQMVMAMSVTGFPAEKVVELKKKVVELKKKTEARVGKPDLAAAINQMLLDPIMSAMAGKALDRPPLLGWVCGTHPLKGLPH